VADREREAGRLDRSTRDATVTGALGSRMRLSSFLSELVILVIALVLMWWTGLWPRLEFDPVAVIIGALVGLACAGGALLLVNSQLNALKGLREDFNLFINLFADSSLSDLAIISVLAGICEEALFRGVAQAWVATWSNAHIAVIIVAVVFGLTHAISVRYAVFVTVLGLVLGYLFYFTGSILAAMMAHAVYDFFALLWATRALNKRPASQTS